MNLFDIRVDAAYSSTDETWAISVSIGLFISVYPHCINRYSKWEISPKSLYYYR